MMLAMLALLAFGASPAAARTDAAIVLDGASGQVIFEQNADIPIFPASLTKMMTLFLTFEALDRGQLSLDQTIPISAYAAAQPPTKIGLPPGSSIRVEDAIMALVTKSANDIAMALGEALGESEQGFAARMNYAARRLGMNGTHFVNPSGLPEPRQHSTARDLATLARALVYRQADYYHYFGRTEFHYRGMTIGNHNHLMERYPGMDGLKTGYIRASGFNLAASAVRDGRRLVAVVIGGKTARSRDDRMAALLDATFQRVRGGGGDLPALQVVNDDRDRDRDRGGSAGAGGRGDAERERGDGERAVVSPPHRGVRPLAKPVARPDSKPSSDAARTLAAMAENEPDSEDDPVAGIIKASARAPMLQPSRVGGAGGKPAAVPASAASAPTSAASVPARRQAKPVWSIQVGTFKDRDKGASALAVAQRKLGGDFPGRVELVKARGAKAYQVRLTGFANESASRKACASLRGTGGGCMPAGPEG